MKAPGFGFAAGQTLCPIVAAEFPRVAFNYPIVFLKNEKGEVGAYALLGVPRGKNLFVDADGRWHAAYIPAAIRRYPFIFARTGEADRFALCIDDGSELLSEVEGEPLFTQEGQPAETVNKALKFLKEFQQQHAQTAAVCRALDEQGMFRATRHQVRSTSGKRYNFEGILAIDEAKLNALPDERFLEWRRRGWLPLVYAHLVSLGQIAHLVERYEQERGEALEPEGPATPVVQ